MELAPLAEASRVPGGGLGVSNITNGSGDAAASASIAAARPSIQHGADGGRRTGRQRSKSAKVLENEAAEAAALALKRASAPSRRAPSGPKKRGKKGPPNAAARVASAAQRPAEPTNEDAEDASEAEEGTERPPSYSDNFKRRNRKEQEEKCNFSDHSSINKWIPAHRSKGQLNCPLALITEASSNKAKATVIREWRMKSHNQQVAQMEEVHNRLNEAARQQKQLKGAGKRKGKKRGSYKKSSARKLKDDKALSMGAEMDSDEEEAWLNVLEAQELVNDVADAALQPISGLLGGGENAASTSAAANALKRKGNRRRTKDAATEKRHLNDQVTNKVIDQAEQGAMKVAARTRPAEGVDMEGAFTHTITVTVTNVARPDRNGGGNARDRQWVADQPTVTIVNPGAQQALASALPALQEAMQRFGNGAEVDGSSPIRLGDNATMVTNEEQYEKHRATRIRKKAKTTVSEEDIEENLGEAMGTQAEAWGN